MKTRDLARQHSIEHNSFVSWLKSSGYRYKPSMLGGLELSDGQDFGQIVVEYEKYIEDKLVREERQESERARRASEREVGLSRLMITTGFNFEGFNIVQYFGYVSGQDAVQVDRGTAGIFARATDVGLSLMSTLDSVRTSALDQLKQRAYDMGCNAVIGVDFDYITLDPETASSSGGTMYLPYVFGVTANGTAVAVEEIEGNPSLQKH